MKWTVKISRCANIRYIIIPIFLFIGTLGLSGMTIFSESNTESGSLEYMAAHGASLYSKEDLTVRCGFPEHTKYPRLAGVMFAPLVDTPQMYEELSRFDIFLVGRPVCTSSGADGGFPMGVWWGEGCRKKNRYNLNKVDGKNQKIIFFAKKLNPGLKFFAQASVSHIAMNPFRFSTHSPERFFADNLSPKYFAYTPMIRLAESVPADPAVNIFHFDPDDLKKAKKMAKFPRNATGWNLKNAYDWTYCCFYDNDNNAERGCFEIMAVSSVNPSDGTITMVTVGKRGRTILGTAQSYSKGARFGFLSTSERNFASLSIYMNFTLSSEPAGGNGGDLTWVEYVIRHLSRFIMKSKYRGRYLADGFYVDADDEDISSMFAWSFIGPKRLYMDFNLDGKPDNMASASREFMKGFENYTQKLALAVKKSSREDMPIIKNGAFLKSVGRTSNGRIFEDFNGGFQDPTERIAEKRYIDLFKKGHMKEPVIVVVNERVKHGTKALVDWHAHRYTMAFTIIAGEGYYALTGPYSIGFRNQPGQKVDRWYDEYSVDPFGIGCNHPDYSGKTKASYRGWLGEPVTPGVKLAPRTLAREFQHGAVLCTSEPTGFTFDMATLFPGSRFKRIQGYDDPSFNNGEVIGEKLFLPANEGIFLFRMEG